MSQMVRDPMYLVMSLGMPVLITWIMGFLPPNMAGLATGGVISMFLGLNLIMSAASVIEEKQTGTWRRLLAAPVARWEIVCGYLLKLLALAWAQAAVLLVSARYLFKVPWCHFTWAASTVLGSYILAMAGLGVLLSTVLKTYQQVPAVGTGISVAGTMLSGVFFPAEGNKVMLLVSKVSPQGWAARCLDLTMGRGAGLSQVASPVLWMTLAGLGFLALGIARVRYE